MARKTKRKLEKYLDAISLFKFKCLIRRPNYREAYEEYEKLHTLYNDYSMAVMGIDSQTGKEISISDSKIKKYNYELCKIREGMDSIKKNYKTDYMYDPDTSEPWKLIRNFNASATLKACSWVDSVDYKTVKVNIASEKEVILHEMSQLLDVMKKAKKEHEPKFQINKARRRFMVFDFRNEKPPIPYNRILGRMQKQGYYNGKSLEKGINLVKKDYYTAFYWVSGMAYDKEYDKRQFKKSEFKGCENCPEHKHCKELCAEAAYAVREVEVSRKEKLS
jgi:hypothetical protein